jgi:hypothetical protein
VPSGLFQSPFKKDRERQCISTHFTDSPGWCLLKTAIVCSALFGQTAVMLFVTLNSYLILYGLNYEILRLFHPIFYAEERCMNAKILKNIHETHL